MEVQGSVASKMSAHGTFPRVEEVAVLAKSLQRQIRAYTAHVEKVVVLAKSLLQAQTALAEVVVFSVEYKRTRLV